MTQPSLLNASARAKPIRSGWRGSSSVAAKTGFDRAVRGVRAGLPPPVQDTRATAVPRLYDLMATSTVPTHLVWPVATDAKGIDSYRVRPVASAPSCGRDWTFNRFVDRSMTIAATYDAEIFARDRGGQRDLVRVPVPPGPLKEIDRDHVQRQLAHRNVVQRVEQPRALLDVARGQRDVQLHRSRRDADRAALVHPRDREGLPRRRAGEHRQ